MGDTFLPPLKTLFKEKQAFQPQSKMNYRQGYGNPDLNPIGMIALLSKFIHGSEAERSDLCAMISGRVYSFAPALVQLLQQPDLDLVRWTLWALRYIHTSWMIEDYLPAIRRKAFEVMLIEDAPLRCAAVHILINDQSPEATEALRKGLKDSAPSVRYEIITVLAVSKRIQFHASLYEDIVVFLYDHNPTLQLAACEILEALAEPAAKPFLLLMLKNSNIQIREAAARALIQLDPFQVPYGRYVLQGLLKYSPDNYNPLDNKFFGIVRRQPNELSNLLQEELSQPVPPARLKNLSYLLFGLNNEELKRFLPQFLEHPNTPAELADELNEIQTILMNATEVLLAAKVSDFDTRWQSKNWKKLVFAAFTDLVTARNILHQRPDLMVELLNIEKPGFYNELGLDRLAELLKDFNWSLLNGLGWPPAEGQKFYWLGFRIARVMLWQDSALLLQVVLSPERMKAPYLEAAEKFIQGLVFGFEEVDDAGDGPYEQPLEFNEVKRVWPMVLEPLVRHIRPVLPDLTKTEWSAWAKILTPFSPYVQPELQAIIEQKSDSEVKELLSFVLNNPPVKNNDARVEFMKRMRGYIADKPVYDVLYLYIELLTAEHPANRATAITYLQRELTCRQQLELGVSILTYGTRQEKYNLADFIQASGRMFKRSLHRLANHEDPEVRQASRHHLGTEFKSNLFSDF